MLRSLIAIVFLFFCGCISPEHRQQSNDLGSWLKPNGKIKVLSTTAMIADLVSQVGKDKIDQLTLIVGDIDPHTYELVKGDDEKLNFANVIFSNGLGLEHGASLQRHLQLHPFVVSLGNEILENYPELIIKIDKQIDPHIWMDISLMEKTIDPIVQALSKLDPLSAEEFQKNGEELKRKMGSIDAHIFTLMQSIPQEKRYLVTSHDAFNYFARRYLEEPGQEIGRCIAPEGLAPEGQLSIADIQAVIDQIRLHSIHVIFSESNVNKDSLRKIIHASGQKGIKVRLAAKPLYADAMGSPEASTYLGMVQYDAEVIAGEWKNE